MPRKRASRLSAKECQAKRCKTEQVELSLSDVTCPICFSIEIEPVILPCQHEFCLRCFTESIFKANKQCPLCRLRVGAWTRTATKECNLVNKARWDAIKRTFPDEVNKILSGQDVDVAEECVPAVRRVIVSSPGEIRREYEEQMRQLADELAQEARVGEELARKIAEEEEWAFQEKKKLEESDQLLARNIASAAAIACGTSSQSYHVCADNSIIKKECKQHVMLSNTVQSQEDSRDSIGPELRHFLPICIAPQTPVTATLLTPAARAPECMSYQPQLSDTALLAKTGTVAVTRGAATIKVTSPHSLKGKLSLPESEEGQAKNVKNSDVIQKQVQEDYRLARRIYFQFRKEERRSASREDYELRSRSASKKLEVKREPRSRRCN